MLIIFYLFMFTENIQAETADVNIHGFISQGFLKTSHNNYLCNSEDGSFQFNEMGINFNTQLSDKLRMGCQFFARDLGEVGNDEIKLDWASADYRLHNLIGFRIGKIKISHGLYNDVRDVDAVRTNILLPRGIYMERSRAILVAMKGFGIYGEIPGNISYQAGYGTIEIPETSYAVTNLAQFYQEYILSGYSGYGNSADSEEITSSVHSVDVNHFFNSAVQWDTPLNGLKLAASSVYLSMDIFMDSNTMELIKLNFKEISISVFSAEYSIGDTIMTVEYAAPKVKGDVLTSSIDINRVGYYASISHRFTDYFEISAYYAETFSIKTDKDGDRFVNMGLPRHLAWEKDICLSVRFDIINNWIIKLESHLIDGTMLADTTDSDLTQEFFLFAAKLSYKF